MHEKFKNPKELQDKQAALASQKIPALAYAKVSKKITSIYAYHRLAKEPFIAYLYFINPVKN